MARCIEPFTSYEATWYVCQIQIQVAKFVSDVESFYSQAQDHLAFRAEVLFRETTTQQARIIAQSWHYDWGQQLTCWFSKHSPFVPKKSKRVSWRLLRVLIHRRPKLHFAHHQLVVPAAFPNTWFIIKQKFVVWSHQLPVWEELGWTSKFTA